jgi:hypothetical protein
VEKLEKLVARAGFTVQKNRLTLRVGICVIQNPWRKTPIAFLEVVKRD